MVCITRLSDLVQCLSFPGKYYHNPPPLLIPASGQGQTSRSIKGTVESLKGRVSKQSHMEFPHGTVFRNRHLYFDKGHFRYRAL